jgi:hypothetical protein
VRSRIASPLVAAAAALLVAACQSLPVAELRGSGDGPSDLIALAAGSYRIDWSGTDVAPPRDGCLLGLRLELTNQKPQFGSGQRVPKLTYRDVPAGTTLTGRVDALSLVDGLYRIRAEGSCAWQVRVTPIPAPSRL